MDRIDRVVWKGKAIETDRLMIGRLVYRNDEPFLKQRDKIIRLQSIATIVALGAIAFFLVGSVSMGFFSLVLLWVIMLITDVVQINIWRGLDRGIVVHENGLDALDYRAFTVGRIFVPLEEISHLGMGLLRFNIYLRHSKKKLFCHKNMVDYQTIWHIGQLLEGRMPEQKGPELIIYSEDGASRSAPQFRI